MASTETTTEAELSTRGDDTEIGLSPGLVHKQLTVRKLDLSRHRAFDARAIFDDENTVVVGKSSFVAVAAIATKLEPKVRRLELPRYVLVRKHEYRVLERDPIRRERDAGTRQSRTRARIAAKCKPALGAFDEADG